jgi:NAD(P)-dependent dehydrogenase (short-subunit alcohol dehydrogenase family)
MNVVITGARGGVAQALRQRLATLESGAEPVRLALLSREPEALSPLAAHEAAFAGDFNTAGSAQQAMASVCAHFGQAPDAWVHCVGSTVIAPITRTTEAQYRACMAANIDSAFYATQAYLAQLSERKQPGNIVLFSSVVASMGVTNHAAIAAAKGAIEALTRALAADYASAGVRINCIAPGLMQTPMTQRMLGSESAQKQIAAQYPLGHYGQASDAAELAAWLISPQSRWITGQIMHLDGGFSAIRPYVKPAS